MPKSELLYQELSYKIIGLFYKVHKKLGCGFPEKVYQGALEVELKKEKIPFEREKEFNVIYEDQIMGRFRLDMIIDNKIVIELKALERMPKVFREQLISYLKATPYELGFLVNFGTPKVEYVRIIRSKPLSV